MPNVGWLKVGLWLIHKEDPHDLVKRINTLFRVTKIVHDFIELEGLEPESKDRIEIKYIHQFYQAPKFFVCDDCCRKPFNPILCKYCLQRRTAFPINGKCELPRFCTQVNLGYPEILLPMEFPTQERPKDILSRYKRPWVI
jgi:hypothetical protein